MPFLCHAGLRFAVNALASPMELIPDIALPRFFEEARPRAMTGHRSELSMSSAMECLPANEVEEVTFLISGDV